MKSLRWVGLLAVLLSACTSSTSTSPAPSQALNFNKLYVSQFQACGGAAARVRSGLSGLRSPRHAMLQSHRNPQQAPGCVQLQWYVPPFSDTSTPANALSSFVFTGDPAGVTFNSAGTAFVIDNINPADIEAFTNPIGANKQAKFDIPLPGITNPVGVTWYKGNLWFSDLGTGTVGMISPPFSASSTPAFTISTGVDAAQIAFDSSGDMAVASNLDGEVLFYTAPVTAASVPSAVIDLGTAGAGVAFDSSGTMYASLIDDDVIDVFTPPFSNASTPSFSWDVGTAPLFLNFDKHGNLWDTDETPEAQEWSPPFSDTSTAVTTITNGMTTAQSYFAFGP